MAKVLISFLGIGRLVKGTPKREYEPATYKIGETEYEKSFVSLAIREHYEINKLILIGTPRSMWEEVYRTYAQEDNIWLQIGEECAKKNHKSKLEIPHQEDIEKAMGDGSKVVLVRYGINAEEIRENSEIILGLDTYLNEGDELYVDITNSFRSLPLYIMNLLIYLRDVSTKKVSIKGIYYGMLEATKEVGHTPIVDLSEVLNVNSWISGAYSFMEFGNAYKIASLLESDPQIGEPKMFSNPLREFSETKNLNHLSELENQVGKMQVLRNTNDLPLIAKMVIDPVVGEFLKTVQLNEGPFRHSDFQYQLAKWHYNHHNYAAAYTTLNEAITTRACELRGYNSSSKLDRDRIKSIWWHEDDIKEYAKLYSKVSKNRNAIVHCLRDNKGRILNTANKMIRELNVFINQYEENL